MAFGCAYIEAAGGGFGFEFWNESDLQERSVFSAAVLRCGILYVCCGLGGVLGHSVRVPGSGAWR